MQKDKLFQWLARSIWVVFLVLACLTAYVNWYMPHGPMYDTGDVICQNDGRGPCGEAFKEDTRTVNIPEWAKFLRTSESELLLMALVLAGIIVSNRPKGGYKSEA